MASVAFPSFDLLCTYAPNHGATPESRARKAAWGEAVAAHTHTFRAAAYDQLGSMAAFCWDEEGVERMLKLTKCFKFHSRAEYCRTVLAYKHYVDCRQTGAPLPHEFRRLGGPFRAGSQPIHSRAEIFLLHVARLLQGANSPEFKLAYQSVPLAVIESQFRHPDLLQGPLREEGPILVQSLVACVHGPKWWMVEPYDYHGWKKPDLINI